MKAKRERKPYEKPQVILDRRLEALAADCGTGANNIYLGTSNCKGATACTILYS